MADIRDLKDHNHTVFFTAEHPERAKLDLFRQHDGVHLADSHWAWHERLRHVQANTKQLRCDPAWLRV